MASAADTVIVDEELYGPAPGYPKDDQQYLTDQAFRPNVRRQFTFTYIVPENAPPGLYAFNAGVFAPNWGASLAYVDNIATYFLN
jgi:hypothetical protein